MKRAVKNVNHFFAALFVCLYFRSIAAGSLLHGHLEGSSMSAAGPRGVSTMETLSREISCRHAHAAMREWDFSTPLRFRRSEGCGRAFEMKFFYRCIKKKYDADLW